MPLNRVPFFGKYKGEAQSHGNCEIRGLENVVEKRAKGLFPTQQKNSPKFSLRGGFLL